MPQRLSKFYEVAEVIAEYIARKGLRPGSRLPGEFALAKICGVSRPSLRQALIVLELRGDVEIREGIGAFVCQPADPISFLSEASSGPLEVLRARSVIECGIAADAALNATSTDLNGLAQKLEQLKYLVRTKSDIHTADREFHLLICKASGNKTLMSVVEALWAAMFKASNLQMNNGLSLDDRQTGAIIDYENIVAAIVNRNPKDARLAMKRRLQHLQEHFSSNERRYPTSADPAFQDFTPHMAA